MLKILTWLMGGNEEALMIVDHVKLDTKAAKYLAKRHKRVIAQMGDKYVFAKPLPRREPAEPARAKVTRMKAKR